MHLIIGGAYQGKTNFAMAQYALAEDDVFYCTQDCIDFSRPCIANLEEYVLGCILRGEDPTVPFFSRPEDWADKILICRDISGGLVPLDRTCRAWREATGKLCQFLSREAESVSRIFCGLEQRLK